MHHEYVEYPMLKNCNYMWSFGAQSMISLVLMILTGIFLAMHCSPNTEDAFNSVERIMRDVNYGWLLRYLHANGRFVLLRDLHPHLPDALLRLLQVTPGGNLAAGRDHSGADDGDRFHGLRPPGDG